MLGTYRQAIANKSVRTGGGRGIRTPVRVTPQTVFKTAGFNHSPIPPISILTGCRMPMELLRIDRFEPTPVRSHRLRHSARSRRSAKQNVGVNENGSSLRGYHRWEYQFSRLSASSPSTECWGKLSSYSSNSFSH